MTMSPPPPVSVVIVSWNAHDYLAQCLASLKYAYSGPLDTVVVDNGSTDGSPTLVMERFPEVKLIRNKRNLGFAKASNIGISNTSGEYVALINSDVKVIPGCITTLLTFLRSQHRVGLVGPLIVDGNGIPQRSYRDAPDLLNALGRAFALDTAFAHTVRLLSGHFGRCKTVVARRVDVLSGCFWLTERRILQQVGLLDERFFIYGEDMDWCKRFRDRGWGVVFVPEARAIHYGGASSANSPIRFFIEKQKADIQYWHKHHSSSAVACYFGISLVHHVLRVSGYALNALVAYPSASARHKIKRSAACLRWMILNDGIRDTVVRSE